MFQSTMKEIFDLLPALSRHILITTVIYISAGHSTEFIANGNGPICREVVRI
jgi:hypothetical protein